MAVTSSPAAPQPSRRTAPLALSAALLVWALGTALGESLCQVGLAATAILVWRRRRELVVPADLKAFVATSGALALYQALSPALVRLAGSTVAWPRSGRYGQFVDTFGAAACGLAAQVAAPSTALAATLAAAWLASVWVGAVQHFVEWPFGQPLWTRTPVGRVHENFAGDGPPRFGAGGLLFHRLRFAHGAVAMLGPALAFVRSRGVWRWGAMALTLHLLAAPYLGFARAALGVALLVAVAAAVVLLRGRARLALLAGAVLLAAVLATSPAWRARIVRGVANVVEGERRVAMEAGWRLVREHPFLGVGFGNHKPMAFATAPETQVTEYLATDSHNVALTVWAETGVLGLLLWAAMHVCWLRAAWRRARLGSPWAVGGLLSWLGFQLLGLVHYLPYHTGVHLSFSLVWGLALCPWPGLQTPARPADLG